MLLGIHHHHQSIDALINIMLFSLTSTVGGHQSPSQYARLVAIKVHAQHNNENTRTHTHTHTHTQVQVQKDVCIKHAAGVKATDAGYIL
jgi:hypothetical protein